MNLTEVRRAVSKMKAALFKNSNSYSQGMLKSHFKGTGLTFKDHQEYAIGDDTRFIDWKLLAKTRHPYIKVFEEERNIEITVVIDASPTMFSGYDKTSKLEAAIELTCLLYLLANETKDFVSVIVVSDDLVYVHKKNGEEGMALLLNALSKKGILRLDGRLNLDFKYKKILSDLEKRSEVLKHLFKKRELVLFSDFNEFLSSKDLKRILFQKRVHAFKIVSPLDESKKSSYLLSLKENILSSKIQTGQVLGNINETIEASLNKRMKKLSVKERYLESFIKEMM